MRDSESRERLPDFRADVVADADGDFLELIEHIELGQGDGIESVQHRRGAEDGEVEPAGAARAAGHGAELVAARAQMLAVIVVQLRRKRATADARGVRLRY